MTPRKPRPRQHTHSSNPTPLIQASDYESDAQFYVAPTTRTNTQLNLSVLQRYCPSITAILSIAANAVVYHFIPSTNQWERSGVEGTLFVCEQASNATAGSGSFCVVVLNRRGLDNVILDLATTEDVEITTEFVILRFQDTGGEQEEQKVLGLWMHADKDDTREINANLIFECWQRANPARAARAVAADHYEEDSNNGRDNMGNGNKSPALGRKLSLRDLFGTEGLR